MKNIVQRFIFFLFGAALASSWFLVFFVSQGFIPPAILLTMGSIVSFGFHVVNNWEK